jgi:hypothetical protein
LDLSLSPDLEAYWCYLLLFCLSFIVALVQVRTLLKGYRNVWATTQSWLLLSAYTSVPLLLFWVLDRADALHDTSLFATILIALTYRQILAGGNQSITIPSGLASAWQPFVAWSDKIAAGIRDRIARNSSRYDREVIQSLATRNEVYEKLRRLVLNRAPNPADLQKQLDSFNALSPPLDQEGVLERKATYLYFSLRALPDVDAERVFRDEGIISQTKYYLYAQEWGSRLLVFGVVLLLVIGGFNIASRLRTPADEARYYLWRFEKPNVTSADRARAAEHLEQGIHSGDKTYINMVRQEFIKKMRFEVVPMETAERMLKLFYQKSDAGAEGLIEALADALRTEDPDLRGRIEKTLVYLADERGLTVPSELRAWQPSKEDALTCIDKAANMWAQVGQVQHQLNPGVLSCLVPGHGTAPK